MVPWSCHPFWREGCFLTIRSTFVVQRHQRTQCPVRGHSRGQYVCPRGWEVKVFDSSHRSVLSLPYSWKETCSNAGQVLLGKDDQATNHRAGSSPSLATCLTFELRKVSNLPIRKKNVRLDRGEWRTSIPALSHKTNVKVQCSHANENSLWGWFSLYTNIEGY